MTDSETKRPKVGSVWTWRKDDPKREAQVTVANVQYYGFDWFVFIERCDGARFEDGLKQVQVQLERFYEKASEPDNRELRSCQDRTITRNRSSRR
jgi:hypothetical protein